MGSEIVIRRIYDVSLVIKTLTDLWDEIAEDGAELKPPNVLDEYYIGVFCGDKYLGMARVYPVGQVLYEGHIFLIDRSKSYECGKALLEWCKDNIISMERLSCRIPECYKNVAKFVESIGFSKISYNSKCYLWNDDIIGINEYSIHRDEIWAQ